MFTLYCDDSGTHAASDVAVAGCYVSTVQQWIEFARNWDEANKRENFGVFHMADFVGRHAQFASLEWADQKKRDRTIGALINRLFIVVLMTPLVHQGGAESDRKCVVIFAKTLFQTAIIKTRTKIGFSAVVVKSAYDEVIAHGICF
jgi:hypothetical protein